MMGRTHRPVLLKAVIAAINPRAQAIYVDGTFGGGGYSRGLLEVADCSVLGIDRDPEACARGATMAQEFDGRPVNDPWVFRRYGPPFGFPRNIQCRGHHARHWRLILPNR